MIHGYRADALAGLGLDAERRREVNPALVDVSLDAYGWEGPWRNRRGFDSLVQMSCGIAEAGMQRSGADRPVPLPMQALDHATGYLMAAAAIRGLSHRRDTGEGMEVRASLARTAHTLVSEVNPSWDTAPMSVMTPDDFIATPERTAWGDAQRLKPPVVVEGAEMRWDYPAGPLGSSPARW
jgi:crotonobetainyl-CoA:carnitine CoA-transferase CaiB-like acyl-CoA transferase